MTDEVLSFLWNIISNIDYLNRTVIYYKGYLKIKSSERLYNYGTSITGNWTEKKRNVQHSENIWIKFGNNYSSKSRVRPIVKYLLWVFYELSKR